MDAVADKSHDLDALTKRLLASVEEASDLATLEAIRVSALGKKGEVSELMKQLGTMPPEARKDFGAAVNAVKHQVAATLETRKAVLEAAALTQKLATDRVDITLPVRPSPAAEGRIHPISRVWEELMVIFADMGFSVA
ncbi:MAG: phenylalanine--tRNA ligase subunit alpha, partial [Rhodomicrobium sp.]